ncbi:hypothetical protein SS1G_12701 [Sclerotinia sclerotiorum 1980 UF-70]|uniref:SAM and PH domain-containing protein n=2 Tax=Sclerotinia sclerotiorum (strain ATCC 18683 / 1980 / Ss-1) TaxID=665079 RepID=A7F526_SCLS1|nr:hypothetical protein SS1G_12701 [Sclerotinia sclerotiorum 1980 UF-70]APA06581.1 hypothetical protein sscle_02g013510 [Sclerotinia sclerotiorum 1980 UF-70]EDN97847.1 hypothetical protein SS1G_12701 [Sclerotinia sclerotiorum 1980 UF-70]
MAMRSHLTAIDTRVEMFQNGYTSQPRDTFLGFKETQYHSERPLSSATIFDTDFEDDVSDGEEFEETQNAQQYVEEAQYGSDFEEDLDYTSLSYRSGGRASETTLSSYEEVFTPTSATNEFQSFNFDLNPKKPVEGPRGPHLFRSSVSSSIDIPSQYVLEMSPITPQPSTLTPLYPANPLTPVSPDSASRRQRSSVLTENIADLDLNNIVQWTPRQVARWMHDAGFEWSIVEKFEENDISGAILTTLKFEDLRELGISSFGQRTKVWNEIHILRGSAPSTPKPVTPIEETSPATEFRMRKDRSDRGREENRSASQERNRSRRRKGSRKARKHETVLPFESISIVGIEQLMPKPHKCSKGENCGKWRKQQRLIAAFNKDHPVSPEEGGSLLIAGDPGNALTARPISDAVPSVVASSDVLGPGSTPALRYLEEESLRNVALRDPQDNVKQFIKFQHLAPNQSSEEPSTPPYEMFPPLKGPIAGLRGLPKLSIPPPRPEQPIRSQSATGYGPCSATAIPNSAVPFSPYQMERAEALSPELRNETRSPSVYRFGTPFSEMDVPVTAVPMSPVAREASQSVPPNMTYRPTTNTSTNLSMNNSLQRSLSRISNRRPSLLPRVDEYRATETTQSSQPAQVQILPNEPARTFPETTTTGRDPTRPLGLANSIRAYSTTDPWAQFGAPNYNPAQATTSAPLPAHPSSASSSSSSSPEKDAPSYAGWMKKRRTKMLRHEWHEHHFTLRGTTLAMHKDASAMDVLECIDVDDYAIACSSLASSSKLNAAFKRVNIAMGRGGDRDKKVDVFSFQLIPQAIEKGVRMKKRDSLMPGGMGGNGNANNKTHYFAVRSRDERIDWMRELMLAKALKQKSEGYEVNVNGNMI